jgi:streptogrisin B
MEGFMSHPVRTSRLLRTLAVAAAATAALALTAPSSASADDAVSPDRVAAAKAALDSMAGNAKGAWGVDKATGQLVVRLSADARGAKADAFVATARKYGKAVRVERMSGVLSEALAPGQAIYSSVGRCSMGWAVSGNSLLTAGHCTQGLPTWHINSTTGPLLGPSTGSSFPGNDFGIIRNDGGVPLQGGYSAGNSSPGQSVCKEGSTTGTTCGTTLATNVTVNYGGGNVVGGLYEVNICVEPGDSGGALHAGNTALGITSGSLLSGGRCLPGSQARGYFQPVTEALSFYGVSLV